MKEIVDNVLKEYKEIKLINEMTIDKINNENLIIDNFLRDIKLIVDCYENKIKALEERVKKLKAIEDIFEEEVLDMDKLIELM